MDGFAFSSQRMHSVYIPIKCGPRTKKINQRKEWSEGTVREEGDAAGEKEVLSDRRGIWKEREGANNRNRK